MEFIDIPEQIFQMGCTEDDPDALYMETPVQEVHVSSFQITEEPISNQTWLNFINESGYKGRGHNYLTAWREQKGNIDPKAPATYLCHEDVTAFCEHYQLKLPTEAQWESAAVYMGRKMLGLWQWCRDPWDEWYFDQLLVLKEREEVRISNPIIERPDIEKVHLLKQPQAALLEYLSSFGTVRGCGKEWLRFDRSLRFPLKPTPQRRAQAPLVARHHCIGFRPVYEADNSVQGVISSWEEVLYSDFD